jgi:hypothetical protein
MRVFVVSRSYFSLIIICWTHSGLFTASRLRIMMMMIEGGEGRGEKTLSVTFYARQQQRHELDVSAESKYENRLTSAIKIILAVALKHEFICLH